MNCRRRLRSYRHHSACTCARSGVVAEYTITTTAEQEATLAWYMTQLHGESPPLAAINTWMQALMDEQITNLAGQQLTLDLQDLMNAYRAKTTEERTTLLSQLRTLLGLD